MEEISKEIRRAFIVCLPYLCIVFFRDDLDRLFFILHSHLGNSLLSLYMLIATLLIFIFFLQSLTEIWGLYKVYSYRGAIPLVLYFVSLINCFWSPWNISNEVFRSPIVHFALRKEKYGHAQMKMRANGKIEIRYPGPLGQADWEYGQWSKSQDTFCFKFDKGKETIDDDDMLSDTMIVADGLLYPLRMPADTVKAYKDYLFKLRKEK